MTEFRIQDEIAASGFFVLRTPLLPFTEVEAWSSGLEAPTIWPDPDRLPAALAADRRRLRRRLERLIERSEIREALFVAAPALEVGVKAWRQDPASKKGRRAEGPLVRYFLRMASRPTPFGLFAGCSTGQLQSPADGPSHSELRLRSRGSYRRCTRLDSDYLFALTEELGQDPGLRRRLCYSLSSSLYEVGGRLRYVAAKLEGRVRLYQLVAIDADEYLEAVIQGAANGATIAELAALVVAADADGEIEQEDAAAFVEELIDAQVLVTSLTPPVTGREPIHDLIDQLVEFDGGDGEDPLAQTVASALDQVRGALEELDRGGLGIGPRSYHDIARRLEPLPARVELPRLFQVDMFKPTAAAALGADVVDDITHGVEIFYRLADSPTDDSFHVFREQFQKRYGDRSVPLLEVLDEDSGIGFGKPSPAASPLLQDLTWPPPEDVATVEWSDKSRFLLRLVERAREEGKLDVEIRPQDVQAVGGQPKRPLPDAFHVVTRIAAASPEALARGEYRLFMDNYFGPSGVRLLGRFCAADPEMARWVDRHLRGEEALTPDALFAEIVHLPQGRMGNILLRPILREHEIPYLGRGGADREHQIPLTDLHVVVRGETIELYSERLGRRIVPRLTTAHVFGRGNLVIYRFLGWLQLQSSLSGGWNWGGALHDSSFLPRVTCGRLVLTLARWRLTDAEIRRLNQADGSERYRAVQQLRIRRALPRYVSFDEGDAKLLVDLDNALSVDSFLAAAVRKPSATLSEVFPQPDELCTQGPEGGFVNELVVPFLRRGKRQASPPQPPQQPQVRHTFPPASEWLYLKIYCGHSTADRILAEVVGPAVRHAIASGAADHWFFLRYGDPDWHLRVRLHGMPRRLLGEVLPRVQAALLPRIDDGLVASVQLDTYQRELERYGGDAGIELNEKLFAVDSEAVLELLKLLDGDQGAEARWQLALRGSYQLLLDFGFEPAAQLEILRSMAESFRQEFNVEQSFKQQLAERLRRERHRLAALLQPEWAPDDPMAAAFAVLEERSRGVTPLVLELREQERAGRLRVPMSRMVTSHIHMHVNRLLRSEARTHELVIYDFLYRTAESLAARRRAATRKRPGWEAPTGP